MSSLEADCEAALDGFLSERCWGAADEADELLYKIVQALRPRRQAAQQRRDVISRVSSVLQGMPDFQRHHYRYGDAPGGGSGSLVQLHVFGSFCSSLYHEESDLDLTITGQWRDRRGQLLDMALMSQRDQVDMLHRIRAALTTTGVASAADPSNPPCVIAARVPLVVFTESLSGVHVDISVANHAGTFKSSFLRELCDFDERLEELYRLVKLWAEVHGLNDPKSGTLNSWSLAQMVIFHLQKEGILPPLWQLFHDEPVAASRPLEAPPPPSEQQQAFVSPLPPRLGVRTSAPFELLSTSVTAQRARLQPLYNGRRDVGSGGAEGVPGAGLLLLLAGFFVRFRELLTQWLEDGTNRSLKLSTWLGQWHEGVMWQHNYLVGFEDPFDRFDNTARTLGTHSHHNGGCWKLLDALDAAEGACQYIDSDADLEALLGTLFRLTLDDVADGTADVLAASRVQQQAQQEAMLQQPPPLPRPQQPFAGDAAGLEQQLGAVRI